MITLFLLGLLAIPQSTASPAVGSLSITVLERGTDAPLTDTGVWVIQTGGNAEGRTVRTGPSGVVTVEGLPAGRYIVQVTSDTHLSHEQVSGIIVPGPDPRPGMPVDIQTPGVAEVTVPAGGTQRVVFRLERGSEITGPFLLDDRPVAGAALELVSVSQQKVLGGRSSVGSGRSRLMLTDTSGSRGCIPIPT